MKSTKQAQPKLQSKRGSLDNKQIESKKKQLLKQYI